MSVYVHVILRHVIPILLNLILRFWVHVAWLVVGVHRAEFARWHFVLLFFKETFEVFGEALFL